MLDTLTVRIRSLSKRKIFWGLILIVILTGIYFGYKQYSISNIQPTYQTAVAEKGTLVTTVSATGNITQGNSLNITSQATGVVSKLYFKNGDKVFKGQTIAQITPDLNSAQNEAQAWASFVSASNSLKNAENNVRGAQATLDKTLDDIHLFQYGNGGFDNVGSANETETQKQARTSAQVSLDNTQNNLSSAQANIAASWLSYQQASTIIKAPFDGILSSMTISEGSTITAASSSNSNTTPSQTLGALILPNAKLQASVNLTEIDVTKVKPGQKVTLTMDAFPDKTFTGEVLSINTNGSVSSGVTTYPTVIQFDTDTQGIYPNMNVNAQIITDIENGVMLIPASAVQTANGSSTVSILKNGHAVVVDVETGKSNDTQIEIISGVAEGDNVITSQTNATSSTQNGTTSPFGNTRGGFGGIGGGAIRVGGGGR